MASTAPERRGTGAPWSGASARPAFGRLARYLAGLCAVFLLLELSFRAGGDAFGAASNRILTKAALLDRHGPVEVLFLGSSRSWDGVSPRLFCDALGGGLRGFDLAVTSTNLSTLEALARRYAGRPGLRLVLIEVSLPQLDSGPSPWDETDPGAADLDGKVVRAASRISKVIEHRAAFRAESLERLPGLLFFARSLDGSEVRLSEQLEAVLGRAPETAPALATVSPVRRAPWPEGAPPDERALRLDRVAEEFRRNGVAVAFYEPPVVPGIPAAADVQRFLATRWKVWDFSSAAFPRSAFHDPTHLNAIGRALLSRSLAELTRQEGLLGPTRTSSREP